MAGKTAKIRLFVNAPLGAGQAVPVSRDHANYLFAVMRQEVGAIIAIFNGVDGEWQAEIAEGNKRGGLLLCKDCSRSQLSPPDLWLLFAPIKKARTDFIVEKATEMGASRICPVQTEFTNSDRIRQDRLQAHAVEAAEQCGGTFVPPVDDLKKLTAVLQDWPTDRQLLFCDESKVGETVSLGQVKAGKWAILIGPEGGFSELEISKLNDMTQTTAISLGGRAFYERTRL